jgi:competence protein ComEC
MRALKTTSAHIEARPAPGPGELAAPRPFRAVTLVFSGLSRGIGAAISEQALRWPLLVPLAIAAGCAGYMVAPTEPSWAVLAGALAGPAIFALLTRRLLAGVPAFILLLAAFGGAGALAGKIRTTAVAAPVIQAETRPVRIEGVIAEIDASERSRRLRIHARAIEDLTPAQTPEYVRFSFKGDMAYYPGRAVSCRAILSPPPMPTVPGDYAFHRDAWFQQLGGVGFAIGQCQPIANPPPANAWEQFQLWIGAIRRAIATHVYEAAGEKGGGISAAMISGDRSFITPDDAEALRLSGLAHLLSISGVHMVLAGGIFFFLIRMLWPLCEPLALRVPAPRIAALGAIIACTLYFAISGAEVATQRSYVMAIIAFGAKLFDRPALSLRSLAIAMSIVTLLQPEAVVTPGYQMSFAASASLIALYEMWPRLDRPEAPGVFARAGGWLIGATATSLVASFATMPFALHHFDRAALFSILANLAATPVISFWTTPAAAAAALAAPFELEEIFFAIMGKSLEVVSWISHWSADLSPDFDLPRLSARDMALAALAIALMCVFRGRGRLVALIPAAFAFTGWLGSPRPVAYIATDGSVFLKGAAVAAANGRSQTTWLELTDWRRENGLNPLAVDGPVTKAPCPGKGGACRIETPAGIFQIEPAFAPETQPMLSGAAPDGAWCPVTAALIYTPKNSAPLRLNPCSYWTGGAAIDLGRKGASLRTPNLETGRPWSRTVRSPVEPPLKPPRQPRSRAASQPPNAEATTEPSPESPPSQPAQ